MTCKDCVHFGVCRFSYDVEEPIDIYAFHYIGNDLHNTAENSCSDFKDKSRFIELPCPIGSDVYVIENCTCGSFYAETCESNPRTQARKYIKAVKLPAKRTVKCAKLFIRPFKAEYLFKIGKTVFLTREEAEKKLEEMKK